jgi:hypothetical protein
MLRASVFHAIGLSLERMVSTSLLGLPFVCLPVWVVHSLALLRGLMGCSVADVGLDSVDWCRWRSYGWLLA